MNLPTIIPLKPFPVIAMLATPAALCNHVDFLSDGGFSISGADGAVVTESQTGDPGNILGSEREVTLTADIGSWSATLNAPTGMGPVGPSAGSILLVSANSSDALGSLSLLYDGIGSAGLGGADFSTMWNFVQVDLATISGGALDMRLFFTDTSGNSGMAAFGAVDSAGLYSFAFDDPSYVNAGIDFTMIDSVQVDLETIDQGVSYSVGGITREVVPEPSSMLMLACGGMALLQRRRRSA